MKFNPKAEKLLRSYLYELEKHLPFFKAKDIIKERESAFLDILEDSHKDTQSEISEEEVKDLLNKTGAPSLAARKYRPRQYFIGPGLYPLFSMVIKIVFVVLASMALIGGIVFPKQMAPNGIGEYILAVVNGLLLAFAWICISFFIMGFFVKEVPLEDKWDTSQLIGDLSEEYPGIIWLSIFMAFLLIAALVLNFFQNQFPIFYASNSEVIWTNFSVTGLTAILPWFTAFLGIRFIHTALLIFYKKWNNLTRISDIILNILAVIFPLYLFVSGFQLKITQGESIPDEAITTVLEVFTQLGRVGLLVIIVALIITAGIKIFKLIRNK